MALDEIKKAKRRLSRERGTIHKDWGGRIPIALIYPNSYYLGMSNLGFQTTYPSSIATTISSARGSAGRGMGPH